MGRAMGSSGDARFDAVALEAPARLLRLVERAPARRPGSRSSRPGKERR